MIAKWIDKKSYLRISKKLSLSAGDVIPADAMTEERISEFVKKGQAKIISGVEVLPDVDLDDSEIKKLNVKLKKEIRDLKKDNQKLSDGIVKLKSDVSDLSDKNEELQAEIDNLLVEGDETETPDGAGPKDEG